MAPQVVIPAGSRFPSRQEPSNGSNGKRFQDARRLDSEGTEPEAVAFRRFPDGTLLDLVHDSSKPRLRFLVWRDGRARIEDSFHEAGHLFVPPHLDPSLMSAVRLPTELIPQGGLEDLLRRVQECISTYVD